jgi:hypothetical protein
MRRRLGSVLLVAAAALMTIPAGGAPASSLARGTTWTAPVVLDGAGGANGRVDSAIAGDTAAVMYGGVAHVFYAAQSGGEWVLRHARLGPSPLFETLDGEGGEAGRTTFSVGSDLSAVVYGGKIHVFYFNDAVDVLRHAFFDGRVWRFRNLDGRSHRGGRIFAALGRSSVATVYDGRLEVLYLEETGMDVRRASYDGTTWSFADLDGDSTLSGRTVHEVGFNLDAAVWGGSLHALYYEADPAYGRELGWVREAAYDGSSWTYGRAFRTNAIVPGKTLALGVVADDDVVVAYNTAIQGDPRLRWRRWDGGAWSDGKLLVDVLYGDLSTHVVFVVAGGSPTLAFSDPAWGAATYFDWSGDTVTQQYAEHNGSPSSTLVVGGIPRIYWGAGVTGGGCCDSLLLRTSRP